MARDASFEWRITRARDRSRSQRPASRFQPSSIEDAARLEARTLMAVALVEDLRLNGDGFMNAPGQMSAVGSTVYFFGFDKQLASGTALYRTSGTAATTERIVGGLPRGGDDLTEVNGRVFFTVKTATQDVFDESLWVSNGTTQGTTSVGILGVGQYLETASFGGEFFALAKFSASTSLVRSDGTAAGTKIVRVFAGARELVVAGDKLYFAANASDGAGDELWVVDAVGANPKLVGDINPGSASAGPTSLTASGSQLFFVADGLVPNTTLVRPGLYRTNGQTIDRVVDQGATLGLQGFFTNAIEDVEGTVFFYYGGHPTYGSDLWRTNGTTQGTYCLDLAPGTASISLNAMGSAGGLLYYSLGNNAQSDLYALSPNDNIPVFLRPFESAPRELTDVDGTLFFAAADNHLLPFAGEELWSSKGTATTTGLAGDIRPGSAGSLIRGSIVDAEGTAYFGANDGTRGSELWRATPAGVPTFAKVYFPGPVQTASFENGGAVTITVALTEAPGQQVSVVVDQLGGTATKGVDYTGLPRTVTFAANQTSQSFTISVANDAMVEPDETIGLILRNPVGVEIQPGSGRTHTLIDDDDTSSPINAPQVNFASTWTSVAWEGVTPHVQVVLSKAVNYWVAVDIAVTGGSAAAGADYLGPIPSTLMFAPGETWKLVAFPVHIDGQAEGIETIELTLQHPFNSTLGVTVDRTIYVIEELAGVVTWDGGGGDWNWSNPLNWSNNVLPGQYDFVLVDVPGDQTISYASGTNTIGYLVSNENLRVAGGSLTIKHDAQLNRDLIVAGGTVVGPPALLVSGKLVWSGASTLSGPGVTRVLGGITVSGTATRTLAGRRLENVGIAEWFDTSAISIKPLNVGGTQFSGTWANLAGSELLVNPGTKRLLGSVDNQGTLRILGGSLEVGASFANSGLVDVVSGQMLLRSGVNTGSMAVSQSGTLKLTSNDLFVNEAEGILGGLGSLHLSAGKLQTKSSITIGALRIEGASRIDGAGDITVSRDFSWYAGAIAGAGRLVVDAIGTISGSGLLLERALLNRGEITINRVASSSSPNITVVIGQVGALVNEPGGRILLNPAFVSAIGRFENNGMVRATVGSSTIASNGDAFLNQGAVNVSASATLNLSGGASSGTIDATGASALNLVGRFELRDGAVVLGPVVTLGLNEGIQVSGNAVIERLRLDRGSLDGPGTLNVTEEFTWVRGIVRGAGSLRILKTGALEAYGTSTTAASHPKTLDGRTIENFGNTTWSGFNHLVNTAGQPAGTWINRAGSRFNIIASNVTFIGASFINEAGAVLSMNLASKTTTINAAFQNDGHVEVLAGTLKLTNLLNFDPASKTLSGGSYYVRTPSYLHVLRNGVGADIRKLNAAVTLEGTYARLNNGGTVDALKYLNTIEDSGGFTLSGKNFVAVAALTNLGTISLYGTSKLTVTTDLTNSGAITLSGSADLLCKGTLTNNGRITIGATSVVTVSKDFVQPALNSIGQRPELYIKVESASRYGKLAVTKNAHFGGRLVIERIPGLAIAAGTKIPVLTFAKWLRLFDETVLPLGWTTPVPLATAKKIEVVAG